MPVVVLTGLLLLLTVALFLEGKTVCDCTFCADNTAVTGAAVILGVIATYYLQRYTPLDAVMASALTGIVAHLCIRQHAAAVYCGSFAGMMSTVLFPPLSMLLSATITASFFIILMPVLNGWGGKLGTIAFIGTLTTALLLGKDFPAAALPTQELWIPIIIAAVAGALSTYELQHRTSLSPVAASALTGLSAALLLAYLQHAGIASEATAQVSVVFFCAGFIGMSSRQRISRGYEIAAAGLIAGGIFILTAPIFGGTGGKLGTIAMISVLTTSVLKRSQNHFLRLLRYP